jgi:lincosamide nucleotidyltransferase B/F
MDMTDPGELRLARLDAIARALEANPHALALLGLGSSGIELARLDAYSDLDFFVVVAPGWKDAFLRDLSWLESASPIAYRYRNTDDGYKALFDDGILCEFAVFEPGELSAIPFAPGRVVWKRAGVDENLLRPARAIGPAAPRAPDWLLGEALTSLYVGLSRYRRGERLSGAWLVQHRAVEFVLELAHEPGREPPAGADAFAMERRYEARYPSMAHALPGFMQGYDRTRESALTILEFLERHFPVNPRMAHFIRGLCAVPEDRV